MTSKMKKIIIVTTFFAIAMFMNSACKAEVKPTNKGSDNPTMTTNEPLETQLNQTIQQGELDEVEQLSQAIQQGKLDVVKQLLVDNQIDLKSLKKDIQFRLLDIATYNGHLYLVIYLLGQGIDINISDDSGRIALHYAIWHGKTDIAYYLIDHGADVNAIYKANGGLTPLCCAAEYGDLDLVKYLIKHGANKEYKNEVSGASPIRSAAYRGNLDVFRYLSKQLPVNFDWQLILSNAIVGDNPELVKYIVEDKKANVNKKSSNWGYPIHTAAERRFNVNNVEIMEYLLSKGAKLKDINNGEIFPWALEKCNEETIVFLLKKGVKYAPNNSVGSWPPLPDALDRGQLKLAKRLLKTEKDFTYRGLPLVVFFADGMQNSADIIKFLIQNNINKKDYPQAFLCSAASGDLESVKLLLEAGVDINITDDNGNNAIAITGSQEVASYLIEKGIHTNNEAFRKNVISNFDVLKAVGKAKIELEIPIDKMNKALIQAARIGDEWVVEYLLEKGADPNYKMFVEERYFLRDDREDGEIETTPLIENAMQGYKSCSYSNVLVSAHVTKLLLKAGAKVNMTNQEGKTALHYASGNQWCRAMIGPIPMGSRREREMGFHGDPAVPPTQQHDSIMIALIEGGADLNIQDNAGNTPLMLAAKYNNSAGIQILLKHGAKTKLKNKEEKTFFDLVSDVNGIIALLEAGLKNNIPQAVLDRVFLDLCTEDRYNYDVKKIKILLDNGANVNSLSKRYDTSALHFIVEHGYESEVFYEVINLLLNRGFNTKITEKNSEETVLHIAIDKGRPEKLINLLLDHGADINAKGGYAGDTPLIQCLIDHRPRFDIFDLLIERGANIHIKNKSQMTALTLAKVFEFEKQANKLIANGAKQDLVAEWWLTLCYYSDKFDNLQKLIDQGININIKSTYEVNYRNAVKAHGITALMYMASLNDAKGVKCLLAMGADINVKDNNGKTAMDYPYDNWEGKAETLRALKDAIE